MSFERVVCWDPGRVDQVMRIDADSAQAPTFLAVHTEESLSFERPAGRRTAREFLADFLSTSGDMRAVVIGDSGSGKSHLVRWAGLNIPRERTDLRVVTVPRSGTSLRWIVRRLIGELPPDLQGDYLPKLVRAPDSPSDAKALGFRLLNALAEALDSLEPGDDVEAALAEGLRDFFTDPAMREHHAGDSGIVPDLVRHITSASEWEERDARRRFEEADLHLDDVLAHLDDFAAPTTRFLRILQGNPEFRQRSIELVNAQLDSAVAQTLGIGSGELTEILNGIRRHLANRGETLVLLVEDFVRTEGIDRALLDALIESRDELCQLKLLIAVTTGYYRGELLDTQKTRLDVIINLDGRDPLDEGGRLAPFAARYLNALRNDERDLERWYEDLRADGTVPPLPNRCSGCEYREPCHKAFGSQSLENAGEVGLYPFTADALANMTSRARERSPDSPIDPRALLRDILRPVVGALRATSLREGDFPDTDLVANHGGARLPLNVQEQVRRETGAQAPRHLALLELWSARADEATQLPAELYRALSLSPVSIIGPVPPQPGKRPEPVPAGPEPPAGPSLPEAVQRRLDAIEAWANGGRMTMVTNDLRHLIMPAVDAAIDWDGERLERRVFAGSGSSARFAFGRTGINFARQDTAVASRAVTLHLPLTSEEDAQLRTARALQGLVNFDHYRTWDFPDGLDQCRAVSEQVPAWARRVVDQFHRLHDPQQEWDPVASGVEVLAVGAALASRPPQLDATLEQRLDAILDENWPEPDDLEVRSERWRTLYRQIWQRRAVLRAMVIAHASSMKGGQAGSMIDAARVIGPLRTVARDWKLRADPPARLAGAELPERYEQLLALHADVRDHLPEAAEDERKLRLEWLAGVRDHIPREVARRDVVEALGQLSEAIAASGLPVRTEHLNEWSEQFASIQLDEAIRITEELAEDTGAAERLLPRLAGERRGRAMLVAERFLPAAATFLVDAGSKLRSERESVEGAEALEAHYARIATAFGALEAALEVVMDS